MNMFLPAAWRSAAIAAMLAFTSAAALAEAIPFTAAAASSADNHKFTITWAATDVRAVTVYAGTDPNKVGRDRPVGSGGAEGRITIDLPAAPRWYFALTPNRGAPLVIAERNLRLASAPNFRDAGGYRTSDGRWVKMGLLYRSDSLAALSDSDMGVLRALNIRLICDFRTDDERGKAPDKVPEGVAHLVADVNGSDDGTGLAKILSNPVAVTEMGPEKTAAALTQANRDFVTKPNAQKAYHAIFDRLAHPENTPALFHCSAGKDRTGWAAAVFLSVMGVPRETIIEDYLLTNGYVAAKNAKTMEPMSEATRAAMAPLLGVRAEYLAAAFDEVNQSYRSMPFYLRDGLNLDTPTIAGLKRLYLTE